LTRASIGVAIPLFFIHKMGKNFYNTGAEITGIAGMLLIAVTVLLIIGVILNKR